MIYIQSDTERTLPHHFDCACAMYGAIESGMNYRLTAFDEVASGRFDNLITNHLFVGSVEFMREVFKRIGKTDVRLAINSNRQHELITLGEAQKRASSGEKLFIKPVEIKLFTGFVLDQSSYSCLKGIPSDTKLMAYQPFHKQIISEWRIYVRGNNNIFDSRNYSGIFMLSPNYDYVGEVIRDNCDKLPCAYTVDIGILGEDINDPDNSQENVVIEFNDMWAIGNYGMRNDLYLKCLSDRYFEIVQK